MTKVLVTGAGGQLASCVEALYRGDESVSYYFFSIDELDITKKEEIQKVFRSNDFDYCFNCAAYTNVDGAESEQELAYLVNEKATEYLALACKDHDVCLIHISTDYVFDGHETEPYSTDSETIPVNVYGDSKLQGELRLKEIMDRYFIIRASWLFSDLGKNFVKSMAEKIRENTALKIVDSQQGSPTSCYDLARFVHWIISSGFSEYGTYHFSASNHTSWYGLTRRISGYFDSYDPQLLNSVDHYPTPASRPAYSVMNLSKTAAVYDDLRSWEEGLDEVMKKLMIHH